MDKRNLKPREDIITISYECQKHSHPKLIAKNSISCSFWENFEFINWYESGHLYKLVTFLVKVLSTLWKNYLLMHLSVWIWGGVYKLRWVLLTLDKPEVYKKYPTYLSPDSLLCNWALLTLGLASLILLGQMPWAEGHAAQLIRAVAMHLTTSEQLTNRRSMIYTSGFWSNWNFLNLFCEIFKMLKTHPKGLNSKK